LPHFTFDDIDDSRRRSVAQEFAAATPFPHVVLHDVIRTDGMDLAGSFPDLSWPGWGDVGQEAWQRGKRSCADIAVLPPEQASALRELNEPTFLRFLEDVTGIQSLLPDPYLEGGGLHCTTPGGTLSVHTDFHWHPALQLFRRLNVLIYLNRDWSEGDGGELQMWSKGASEPSRSVAPTFGTCVIFQTDDDSPHGVAPIAEGSQPRKSIATYYYTSAEAGRFSGDAHTHWQEHEQVRRPVEKARLVAYKGAVRASRGLSRVAYGLNPNRTRRDVEQR
jgi:hypothetical protein